MMEMVLLLATMSQRFTFESETDVAIAPSVTLRPKGGLPLACAGADRSDLN